MESAAMPGQELPPPYDASSLPQQRGGPDETVDMRARRQHAVQNGLLASKGRVPWGWKTETSVQHVQQGQGQGEARAPAEYAILTSPFKCGQCTYISYVPEGKKWYLIKCPYCLKTSTINPSKSKWIGASLLATATILIIFFVTAIVIRSQRSGSKHHLIWIPVFSLTIFLRNGSRHLNLPRGTLENEHVWYVPTVHEVAAGVYGTQKIV